MKRLVLVCSFLLSVFSTMHASADAFSYRLYEDSIGMFTPFVLTIEMDGAFEARSEITQITLVKESEESSTLLFYWNERAVNESFSYSWNDDDTLNLSAPIASVFHAVVDEEINNAWGDTSINPTDEYSVWIDGEIILNENGSLNEVPFEISNMTAEESCLWGLLTK